MKILFTFILVLTSFIGFSQSIIDWSLNYKLQLSDFQSPQSEINKELTTYSIYSGTSTDFSFQMSTYEFMFTKNFNSKAKTIFNKNAGVITAPDSTLARQLLSFGQYTFDLAELYTRKFRKEMYEKKGAFSSVTFFQPIFNKLQEEMNAESARVLKATDLGKDNDLLKKELNLIINKIILLSDYCLECKTPKKKKKTRKK